MLRFSSPPNANACRSEAKLPSRPRHSGDASADSAVAALHMFRRRGALAKRLVGRDRDAGFCLSFGEDLEQELGAAAEGLHVAELVDLFGYPHR
jgi:hypothetical protein